MRSCARCRCVRKPLILQNWFAPLSRSPLLCCVPAPRAGCAGARVPARIAPTNQPRPPPPRPQPTRPPTHQRPATAKPATPEVHKPTAKHATTELAQVNCEASNYRTAQINCEVCKYRISTNQTLPGRLSVTCRTQRRVEKVRFGSNTKKQLRKYSCSSSISKFGNLRISQV